MPNRVNGRVMARELLITSQTGTPLGPDWPKTAIERPKSPWKTPESQSKYCRTIGSLRPSASRIWAASWASARCPSRMIAGSPGISLTRLKTIIDIAVRTTTVQPRRRTM